MKPIKNFLIAFLLVTQITTLFANNDKDSVTVKKVKFFPLPALGYTPETRWYIGAVGLLNLRFSDDVAEKPSSFKAEINYTQNKQLILTADFELRFQKENYRLLGENGFYKYPESFWGIGINTSDDDEIRIDANRIEIDNSFLRKISGAFYAGLRLRYHKMDVLSADDTIFFYKYPEHYRAFGGGVLLLLDSRDNPHNASKGVRVSFSGISLVEGIAKADFRRIDTDIRWYHRLFKQNVLALQAISSNTGGYAPIRQFPLLGNDNIMRGYYEGRYRNQHLAAAQAEYRLKIWNWIGATVFAGTGTVFNYRTKFNDVTLLPNYGTGLRIRLDKKDNINLRFDYGMGKNTSGFYVSFGEAF